MMMRCQRANEPARERWKGRRPFFLFPSRSTIHKAYPTATILCPVLSFSVHMQSLRYDTLCFAFRSSPRFAGNVLGIEQKAVLLLLRARTLNCYVTIDECITNIPEVYTYLYMYLPAVPDWLMIRFHACTYLPLTRCF